MNTFSSPHICNFCKIIQNFTDFFFITCFQSSKILVDPSSCIIKSVLNTSFFIIVSQIKKICERKFICHNVTNIHNPQITNSKLISSTHLFFYFWQIICVKPFITERPAVIIKMIIHSITAFMITHFFSWNSTKISMIIITKHESHTFKFWAIHKTWSRVITIEIRLNFFVQSKHSWHIIKIFINIFFDKPILSFQNITK